MIVKQGVKAIIRPPRSTYNFKSMPAVNEIPGFGKVQRTGIAFFNERKNQLYGSFYAAPTPARGNPCVIYLHGNASNQLEGRFAVSLFIPVGINVFCFDFAGCGCSEGNYITLGHFESMDANSVVDMLRNDFKCEKIALWGRSMGAVASLMLSSIRHDISSIVVDSPFSSLRDLCKQIAATKNVPDSVFNSLYPSIVEKIKKETTLDINEMQVLEFVHNMRTPVFFIHGKDDELIDYKNTELLYEECTSQIKYKYIVNGEHNSDRPERVVMLATEFICHHFGINIEFVKPEEEKDDEPAAPTIDQGSKQHFANVDEMLSAN